jgi:hypothetical protein
VNEQLDPAAADESPGIAETLSAAAAALDDLAARDPEVASLIARLVVAVADEASRSKRFARALASAMVTASSEHESGGSSAAARTGRRGASPGRPLNRRPPGPFDPFVVYGEGGESGLRDRLGVLKLEELRNVLAEHGLDNDRLAMRWKDSSRVIERIVERVAARAAKGSAFR